MWTVMTAALCKFGLDRCCLRMKLRFECIIWTIECQSCWLSMCHWYFIWLKQRDEWWWVIAVTWGMWHRWLTIFLSPEFHQGRNMTLVLLGPRWDRDGQLNWERHQRETDDITSRRTTPPDQADDLRYTEHAVCVLWHLLTSSPPPPIPWIHQRAPPPLSLHLWPPSPHPWPLSTFYYFQRTDISDYWLFMTSGRASEKV